MFPCPCGAAECKKVVLCKDMETDEGVFATPATLAALLPLYHPTVPGFTCPACRDEIRQPMLVAHMTLHDEMDEFLESATNELNNIRDIYKPVKVKKEKELELAASDVLKRLHDMIQIVVHG